jgi:hypothetical protein
MNRPTIDRLRVNPVDFAFMVALVICIALAAAAVNSELEKRRAVLETGGARTIDAQAVRRQIVDGTLSDKKAMFYMKAPR